MTVYQSQVSGQMVELLTHTLHLLHILIYRSYKNAIMILILRKYDNVFLVYITAVFICLLPQGLPAQFYIVMNNPTASS